LRTDLREQNDKTAAATATMLIFILGTEDLKECKESEKAQTI
jgi:hypothetical protein